MVSASSLLLLILLLLLSGCLPQLSRMLGSLNEMTALVLSANFAPPLSVNRELVDVSSPVEIQKGNSLKNQILVVKLQQWSTGSY